MQRDSIYSLPVMSATRGIGGYCGVLQYPLLCNANSDTCIECKGWTAVGDGSVAFVFLCRGAYCMQMRVFSDVGKVFVSHFVLVVF